jgi:hypothetical protein
MEWIKTIKQFKLWLYVRQTARPVIAAACAKERLLPNCPVVNDGLSRLIRIKTWMTNPWTTIEEEDYIAFFCYRPQNVPIILIKFYCSSSVRQTPKLVLAPAPK